jgi:homoserine O-acetyltransferase/O-succinyltransferase
MSRRPARVNHGGSAKSCILGHVDPERREILRRVRAFPFSLSCVLYFLVASSSCAPAQSPACTTCAASAPSRRDVRPAPPSPVDPDQKLADLTSCTLESGQTIDACHIGYRTFGTLNAARSNVVLFPTWFSGTTKPLVDIVPDKLVDTKRFFVVLVDALGDGVSTSPSNSRTQARLAFPRFTIRDMVESQRRLLTEVLGVTHLHAVMGISMGGMQAIEWGVTHPDLVDRIVPIVGTPQLTSNDLLLWNTELHALQDAAAYKAGNYEGRPIIRAVLDLHALALTTPAYRAGETSRDAFAPWVTEREADTSFDWNDWHRQLEAMLAHDVTRGRGSLEEAASRVKAKALVVVADQDHMVSPLPARAFARAMGSRATVVALEGPCGHLAPSCEAAKVASSVTRFLAE